MKKGIIFIALFLSYFALFAQNQDLRLGFAGATQIWQRTVYSAAVYQPNNSYFTYHENNIGQGIILKNSFVNSFSVGGLMTYTYRRSSLNFEPQYFMQRSVFEFQKEYYTERVIGMRSFRLPIYFTYRFFKKVNSSFFTFGWIYSISKNYDFQHPGRDFLFNNGELYDGGINYGDDHFKSVLYTDANYWQNFIGLGKNLGDFNVALRFVSRTRKSKKLIDAEIAQWEFSVTYHVVNLSDFKKKRKIYSE